MGAKSSKTNHKQFTIKDTIKYRKYYKTFVIGSGAFLIAFLISSVFAPVQNSDASTVHITNNTSDYFIDITSADSLSLDVTASPGGQLAYAADKINITTNSENGYKLYVSTSGNDNNIYAGGSSDNSGQGYFSPSSGNISSPTTLTQNTWGFALNKSQTTSISSAFANVTEYVNDTGAPTTSSTWAAVPTFANSDQAKISELTGSSNAPNGTDLDIYYGINASTSLPSGDYSTTVTYTAVSEGVNVFDTMQDFTSAKCDAMSTDSSINLTDSRDGKYYRVTKMKDGHCWMTDNLALDGTDKAGNVRTLTPNDSDVTSNVTLAKNIESGTPSNATDVQIFSGVANRATTKCNDSYPYCVENDTKYGNLYNWFAATARSGTSTLTTEATMSICPKGWRLPNNTGDWSYGNLLKAYGAGNGTNTSAGETGGEYVRITQQFPLYFTLAGNYGDNAPANQGFVARYWSSTSDPSASEYSHSLGLDADSGYFYPQNKSNKFSGFSVRCVFSGQEDEIMQNFTSTMCNNLALSTASSDNRKTMIDSRDGKFYKISRLADNPGITGSNGTCWMVSNLALDGADPLGTVRTLTPSDSNVAQNRPLAANIASSGVSAEYDKVQIYSVYANEHAETCPPVSDAPYCVTNDVKYGNNYNWNAATAGVGKQATTGTVTESVCPKGWRLPDGTNAETARSWGSLIDSYYGGGGNTMSGVGEYAKETQRGPLWFAAQPSTLGSTPVQGFGLGIGYLTRTVWSSDTNQFKHIGVNLIYGNIGPAYQTLKSRGMTVRCVTE